MEDSLLRGRRAAGRKALGRGLDALLPAGSTPARELDVERIEPNPFQPRQRFEQAALAQLAASIREHGLVQPVVVTALGDDRFRLIVGQRRWEAARLAGLSTIPAVVKEATDRQSLELALVENVQRADLNPLEEAAAYQRLIDEFGLTQQSVAQRVGKSRVSVTNTLRLLGSPEQVKQSLIEGRISEGHARALLTLEDFSLQLALLREVERTGLTVRQTEERARRLLGQIPARRAASRDADTEALEARLRQALGTKVTLRQSKRGGRIVIEYYSPEEFEGLYERLLGE